ncbi:SMODS domain-containing nucleotidyltransferase [Bradyrhizobium betae]|uniref:SMODS domain-containing nucleotidyltransferase n=1 Tax=Bradyrhizobium betae TaxID=244734 RepID=UPI003D66F44E
MGVGEDFQKFKDNYQITTELITSISYRYKRITRQLNTDFWNTNSETAHSLYVGSYGRDTAARGLSDLDIGFILPNAVYHQYNAHQGNGQSALLQSVKRSIQKTYRTSESFGDGQVVVISFEDNLTFEVLPAFENQNSDSWTYPNANNGGSWKVCNPRARDRCNRHTQRPHEQEP